MVDDIQSATALAGQFKPRVVIALHGIRTHAHWFNPLAERLSNRSVAIPLRLYDYGFVSTWKFLRAGYRNQMVDKFCAYYESVARDKELRIDTAHYAKRPSVVAHSFGSYIIGQSMLKYDYMKFDKIILCGSILPEKFDWGQLIRRDQVNMVLNEYSQGDFWARNVGWVVGTAGASGHHGFSQPPSRVEQKHFEFLEHSGYFTPGHMDSHWIPFFRKHPLGLRVVHGREIPPGKNYRDILVQKIQNIDTPTFGPLSGYDRDAPPLATCEAWIQKNPDTYTFLVDHEGRLQGYINAIPVSDSLFAAARLGKVLDSEIPPNEVLAYNHRGSLKAYLTSIALSPLIRQAGSRAAKEALDILVHGFLQKLTHYAKQGIRLTDFVAVAWTPQGENLCTRMGMEWTKSFGIENHKVFAVTVDGSLPKRTLSLPGMKELMSLYTQF